MKSYKLSEVQRHNTEGDCWVVVDEAVLDVSEFAAVHPGGERVLHELGGCYGRAHLNWGSTSSAPLRERSFSFSPLGSRTKFTAHRGGPTGGQDATNEFYGLHRKEVLRQFRGRLQVGGVKGAPKMWAREHGGRQWSPLLTARLKLASCKATNAASALSLIHI